MYFIRKIKKTKKQTEKSSFIVSLPRKLERKIASYNTEISKRLANFSRFRYFYEDIENPKCFMITIWDLEIPQNGINDKSRTTTIQRSGKSSRYVIIPKKVCSKFGWGVGTELVIGFDDTIDEYVQGAIYKGDNCFMKYDMPGLQVHACIIKFQRYSDMRDLYRTKLTKRKEDLAKEENDALAGNPGYYDMTVTDSNSGTLCSITNHAYSMTAYGEPFIMERVQDNSYCTDNTGNYCTLGLPTTSSSNSVQFTTGDIIYSNGTQTSTSIPYNAGYYYDDTMQNTATVGTQNGNTYTNTSNGAVGSSGQFTISYSTSGGT